MDPEIVIPAIVGIGAVFVALPLVAFRVSDARGLHRVVCPENTKLELVRLDLGRAALSALTDAPQKVVGCTRWPDRAGCDRACAALVGF